MGGRKIIIKRAHFAGVKSFNLKKKIVYIYNKYILCIRIVQLKI